GRDQLASIFGCITHGVSGVSSKNVAAFVRNLNLAIAAEQAAILFRLAVQNDGVVRICLVKRDDDSRAVLLHVLGDFHAFVMRVNGGFRSPSSPVTSAAARAI